MTASTTEYTTFSSERQEWHFLVHEYSRQGHQLKKAVALADCEMNEIRYCDDCGAPLTLNSLIAAYECPACGLKVQI